MQDIDLIGNYNGRLLLIQCKDVSKTISVSEVRKFEASVGIYPSSTSASTSNTFSSSVQKGNEFEKKVLAREINKKNDSVFLYRRIF